MSAPGAAQSRATTIGRIADHLLAAPTTHPVRVAVDGVTASGKTTLAAELVAAIEVRGRTAIGLSMDGFHHRRARRHRQGRDSAQGYYQDAYDFDALARLVLVPLGPNGDLRYRPAIIDLARDEPVEPPHRLAPADAIVVVDGSFLQREELADLWDEVVFVDTALDIAQARGVARDATQLGGVASAEQAFQRRYHGAARRYLAEIDPIARATIVIGNDDVAHPRLRRIGGRAGAHTCLFSYGTLQQVEVQQATFGRPLVGSLDTLPGYRTGWVAITDPEVIAASGKDRHPVVMRDPEAERAEAVAGTAFVITAAELAAADTYEVSDYRRVLARLGSGQDAWVYVADPDPGST